MSFCLDCLQAVSQTKLPSSCLYMLLRYTVILSYIVLGDRKRILFNKANEFLTLSCVDALVKISFSNAHWTQKQMKLAQT